MLVDRNTIVMYQMKFGTFLALDADHHPPGSPTTVDNAFWLFLSCINHLDSKQP